MLRQKFAALLKVKDVLMPYTIEADCVQSKQFTISHLLRTAIILVCILSLNLFPPATILTPLAVSQVGNSTFQATMSRVNPFLRTLHFYVIPNTTFNLTSVVVQGLRGKDTTDPIYTMDAFDWPLEEGLAQGDVSLGKISVIYQTAYTLTLEVTKENSVQIQLQVICLHSSVFYTVTELVVRYVCLVLVLYAKAKTNSTPWVTYILMAVSTNPFFFSEVAFPNAFSLTLSRICSSTYILYLGVYLYYIHPQGSSCKSLLLLLVQEVGVGVLWGMAVADVRGLWWWVAGMGIGVGVAIPLAGYVWRVAGRDYRLVLHRDALLTTLTVYYAILLFLHVYLLPHGWRPLTHFLIALVYGLALVALLDKIQPPSPSTCNSSSSQRENGQEKMQILQL